MTVISRQSAASLLRSWESYLKVNNNHTAVQCPCHDIQEVRYTYRNKDNVRMNIIALGFITAQEGEDHKALKHTHNSSEMHIPQLWNEHTTAVKCTHNSSEMHTPQLWNAHAYKHRVEPSSEKYHPDEMVFQTDPKILSFWCFFLLLYFPTTCPLKTYFCKK